MPPRLPQFNVGDRGWLDAMRFGEIDPARCGRPYHLDLLFRKDGAAVLFSGKPRVPPFPVSVGDVVGVCAEKEVVRVDAGAIVPSRAVVEHAQAIGDWPSRAQPRQSVRLDHSALPVEVAISGSVLPARPEVTPRRGVNLSAECQSFSQRAVASGVHAGACSHSGNSITDSGG